MVPSGENWQNMAYISGNCYKQHFPVYIHFRVTRSSLQMQQILLSLYFTLNVLSSTLQTQTAYATTTPVLAPIRLQDTSTTSIATYITSQANFYGVDPGMSLQVATDESGLVPQQSRIKDPTGPNGREDSWGIWQINKPEQKGMTRDDAMDIEKSTEWAMKTMLHDKSCAQWSTCHISQN